MQKSIIEAYTFYAFAEDKKNELEKIVEEHNFEIEQLEEDVYRVANTIDRCKYSAAVISMILYAYIHIYK